MPEALAQAEVLREDGSAVTLRALWAGRPSLVCFFRHFGCAGCSEHVTELVPFLADFAALDVLSIFVGNGAPGDAAAWSRRHALVDKKVCIVTDPALAAFRAAGLYRSAWRTFGPRGARDFLRAVAGGHALGATRRDLLQQGGALLLDARERVVLFHANESLGDHPRAAELQRATLAMVARARSSFLV